MNISPLARQRRHTLYFLETLSEVVPVFLDTEVDATALRRHRVQSGRRYSTVSYVLHAAARALADHPDANVAVRGRRSPRVARFDDVQGKVTFDKLVDGRRVVVSAVLPDLGTAQHLDLLSYADSTQQLRVGVRRGEDAGGFDGLCSVVWGRRRRWWSCGRWCLSRRLW